MRPFITWLSATAALALALAVSPLAAQTDTTFTYQGNLAENDSPVNGAYNMDFELYDALAGGALVGSPVSIVAVPIAEGLFTVELDFGAAAFDNSQRWLQIAVHGLVLTPRQPITRSPYSIQTRGIFVDANDNVGIGSTTPLYPLHVEADSSKAIYAKNTSSTGGVGVHGTSQSDVGIGVYGEATGGTTRNHGVKGLSLSTEGSGVYGEAVAHTGFAYGVKGLSQSTSGSGVYGVSNATTGTANGVYGLSWSTDGRAVYGYASASSGTSYGGWFQSRSTSGRGVYGFASRTTGINYGGWFESSSTSGRALFGLADANSGTNYGVVGHSNSSSGFDFWASGAGTNYGSPSSRRFKSNVVPIADPLDKLAQLQGVYFDWDKDHGGQHDLGMIAEEVGKILPEIVNYEDNGYDAIGMDYSKMTPLLVEAVNALRIEQQDQVENLRRENAELRAQLKALSDAVEELTNPED